MADSNNKNVSKFFKVEPILQNQNKACRNFYGVYVPEEIKSQYSTSDFQFVYTDKAKCLAILKNIPDARFKIFTTFEDAEKFTKNCQPLPIKCNGDLPTLEKPSCFRSVKSQDLVKFRKAIEKGNLEYVEESIQTNPRYLVSCGDTPSILQEGSRYNSMHISCKHNKAVILKRILQLVSDENLFKRLYPEDSDESSSRRCSFLLDLYLNTPEKGLNETPLHFASKFGSIDCLKVLITYPGCERNRLNKFDQTPDDVAGKRMYPIEKKITLTIQTILRDQHYVPVLRDEDNCLSPQIGAPWSPSRDGPLPFTSSPLSPTFKIRGCAGPMSQHKAEEFYKRWKKCVISSSPSKISSQTNSFEKANCLRISDFEKGLERMGRELASKQKVKWNEYWEFLGTFTDLPSDEGLLLLEKHLKQQYRKVVSERNLETSYDSTESPKIEATMVTGCSIDPLELSQLSCSGIGEICRGLEALRLNASFSPNNSFSKPDLRSVFAHDASRDSISLSLRTNNNSSLNQSELSFTASHYEYVAQSVKISADKISSYLIEAAHSLEQSSSRSNYHVTFTLKMKIKQESANLRQVVINRLESRTKDPLDLSFIHILLMSRTVTPLVESVPTGELLTLEDALSMLIDNKGLYNESFSSDDGADDCDINEASEFDCVLDCLERAVHLAYDLSQNGNNNLEMDLKNLGTCECKWHPVGGGPKIHFDSENNNTFELKSGNKSKQKFSRAHFFLNKVLFGEDRVTNENVVAKQLQFPEEDDVVDNDTSEAKIYDSNTEDDNDSFVSALSSDREPGMVTPEEFIKVYINGCLPSKVDLDVQLALENRNVDVDQFPHIHQWLKLVATETREIKQSWTSPYSRPRSLSLRNSFSDQSYTTPKQSRYSSHGHLGQSPI